MAYPIDLNPGDARIATRRSAAIRLARIGRRLEWVVCAGPGSATFEPILFRALTQNRAVH
jgi:hypothetical protein